MYLLLLTVMEDPCVCIISLANAFQIKTKAKVLLRRCMVLVFMPGLLASWLLFY